jgi:hypothetical protein
MAQYFDITTPVTSIALDDARKGEVTFTVSNATTASIRGESVVIPGGGALTEWFTVDRPVRTYQRGQADQVSVAVAVPMDAPAGSYSIQLRTLLGGGVPEEDFDDGPAVSFEVPEPPAPPPPPPPKKPFPWWILAVIAAIVVAVIVIAGIVFVVTRPGASPSPSPSPTAEPLPDLDITRFASVNGRLQLDVANVGTAPAGPFDVLFEVRAPIPGLPPTQQRVFVPGLQVGEQRTVLSDLQFSPNAFGSATAIADPTNLVRESNENNNTAGLRGTFRQLPDDFQLEP